MQGKAWREGQPEPAEWMITWSDDDEGLTGYPGLNGGTLGGQGTLSFSEFRVERITQSDESRGLEGSVINLDGAWKVRPMPKACLGESGLEQARQGAVGWLEAQVPGEVHSRLDSGRQDARANGGSEHARVPLAGNQFLVVSNDI